MIGKLLKETAFWLPRILLTLLCIVYLVLTLLSNFDALEPYIFPVRSKERIISENLIVGPYPRAGDLEKLRDEKGVSVVVTVLDVRLPQEEALNRREKAAAERLGLVFRNFPLSYFIQGSEENRRQIRALQAFMKENEGRIIYLNSYLDDYRLEHARKALFEQGR